MQNRAPEFFFAITKSGKVAVRRSDYANESDFAEAIHFLQAKCGERVQVLGSSREVQSARQVTDPILGAVGHRPTFDLPECAEETLSLEQQFELSCAENTDSKNMYALGEPDDSNSYGVSEWLL